MELQTLNIRDFCMVNTNSHEDKFVGVKIENGKPIVHFPLGYSLPYEDKILRKDIRNLFLILSFFTKREQRYLSSNNFDKNPPVEFPILAFLEVLDYFMENGGKYYTISETRYKSDTKGKINFKRTVKKETAFIKNGSFKYTTFQVKYQSPLETALITNINKYCVYYAFKKIGWLYTEQIIDNPGIILNKKNFLEELRKRYMYSNIDRDKQLFKAMIAIIDFIDDRNIVDKSLYFGTEQFEKVWEEIIDKVFGIPNKSDYNPKSIWVGKLGRNNDITKDSSYLYPDTIMIYNNKYYVLDAKFYKYGVTENFSDLPPTADINKQITYAEYIEKEKGINEKYLYNAFLMPYDALNNPFEKDDKILKVSEAFGMWRTNIKNYEKIHGILIDVRWLIFNYSRNIDLKKKLLVETIEEI